MTLLLVVQASWDVSTWWQQWTSSCRLRAKTSSLSCQVNSSDARAATGAGIVGREHLVAAVDTQLQAAPHGCLGLWGMRGLGKSVLARAVCVSLQVQNLSGQLSLPDTGSMRAESPAAMSCAE